MLQAVFDASPKTAIAQIIRRLYAESSPSEADARVCAWFKANLKWTAIDPIRESGFAPGAIPEFSQLDTLGSALFSGDPPRTVNPTVAAQGSYDAIAQTTNGLVAIIRWESYANLLTAFNNQGPNPQTGDLAAVIAAT